MGYCIEYGQQWNKKYPIKGKKKYAWPIGAVLGIILVLLLSYDRVGSIVKSWIIPGDPEVTEGAVSSFVAELKDGKSAGEAITVFCREILENAQHDE